MLIRVAPWIFVVLWSTGYIGMKAAAPYAEPMTFLAIRFASVSLLLLLALPVLGAATLGWADTMRALLIGACLHGAYLGGIMYAIKVGMPAGVAALIISFQPILTALIASTMLNERIAAKHWISLVLAGFGVALVLSPKLAIAGSWAVQAGTWIAAAVSLGALTFGTLYQKQAASHLDVRASLLPQYIGATGVTGCYAFLFETREIVWSPQLIGALAWLVIVLSIGAISLLLVLLRENAAWRTSALFYLIPPITAVIAWVLFDEQLGTIQLLGMALVMAAVLAIRPVPPRAEAAIVLPPTRSKTASR